MIRKDKMYGYKHLSILFAFAASLITSGHMVNTGPTNGDASHIGMFIYAGSEYHILVGKSKDTKLVRKVYIL